MTQRVLKHLLVFLIAAMSTSLAGGEREVTLSEEQQRTWARLWEEHQGHKLIMEFSSEYHPRTLAILGVNIVPMTGTEILERHSLVVENGKITAMGPESEVRAPAGANVITPAGKYLMPGLVEAHAHTIVSQGQYLVYLTRGVTSVREMDGWPWMLEARDKAASGRLLIPNLYVTGHILSHRAWDFFMTQVDTPEQMRTLVKEQAAAGYDFIKVHNSMPGALFTAMFQAANDAGLDVVGHIPNEITIARAIEMGMRTDEHFKGYIFDETLEITDQDYVAATAGSELWNTPTFTTYHDHLRGEQASALAKQEDSLRLVPRWLRAAWGQSSGQPADELTELRQSIYPKSRKIFGDLLPVTHQFLAGTDTGTYAYMVPGYALHEEVRILQGLGLSPHEALKTATVNPAIAFRRQGDFGTIEVGKRADFVILNSDPLQDTANLSDIWGVSVRGTWLHRDALDRIASSLELAFGPNRSIPAPTSETLGELVSDMQALAQSGFPYPDYTLEELEQLLLAVDLAELAGRVTVMQRKQNEPIPTP